MDPIRTNVKSFDEVRWALVQIKDMLEKHDKRILKTGEKPNALEGTATLADLIAAVNKIIALL